MTEIYVSPPEHARSRVLCKSKAALVKVTPLWHCSHDEFAAMSVHVPQQRVDVAVAAVLVIVRRKSEVDSL